MIQSTLAFIAGFVAAALIGLLVAPALWARAVRLTRRRIIASMPMTANEVSAEKDTLRAAFAMDMARTRRELDDTRARAARHMGEAGLLRERLRDSEAELRAREAVLTERTAERDTGQAEIGRARERIEVLEAEVASAQARIRSLADALANAEAMHDEALLNASNAQIELVQRDTEIDRLVAESRAAKAGRRESEGRSRSAVSELRNAEAALKLEQRRHGELQRRHERAQARIADLEERLNREQERSTSPRRKAPAAVAEGDGDRALREQILDLAARMVAMTVDKEGPDSPAAKAIGAAPASDAGLAGRVRALRGSASARRAG